MSTNFQNKKFIELANLQEYHRAISAWIFQRREQGLLGSILDVGTSDGAWPQWLLENGFDIKVSDRTQRAVDDLRSRGFGALTIDLENLDFSRVEERFNAVTFIEVLEHLVDPVKALWRINSLVDDSGWLYLSTPNFNYFRDLLKYCLGKDASIHHNPNHVRFFNARTVHWMMRSQGFDVLRWHHDLPGEGRKGRLLRPMLPVSFWRRLSRSYGALIVIEAQKKRPALYKDWIEARWAFYREIGI